MSSPPSQGQRLSAEEIVSHMGVPADFVGMLRTEEIVIPDAHDAYGPYEVHKIRICHTLHRDLGVNLEGLEVVLHLLEIIEQERRQFYDVLQWIRQRR